MNSAVSLQDVTVVLDGKVTALADVTADLPANQVIGFIGPSGAGKTTLMRSIVGRQRLSSGAISIFHRPAGHKSLRETVSYMTQDLSVYGDLTVAENIEFFAAMLGLPRRDVKAETARLLETVHLVPQAKQLVGRLSGGQKQRVSLAIALIGKPKLMVLDEPTVGLDPLLREQLWSLFHRLATEGTTLIISSHVMDEAERCDELLLIRDGRILAQGSPATLRRQTGTETVEQSFLALVGGQA